MNVRIPRNWLIGAALVPTMSLGAAVPVHYGFSAHVNVPMSELHSDIDGKLGVGGSFQVSFETSDRVIVRPRLDVDVFPMEERRRPGTHYRERIDLGSVGIGADVLYAFSGRNDQGLYGLGGVGLVRWSQTYSTRNTSGYHSWDEDDTDRSRVSPYVALGLGYQINRIVGLEWRTVGSKYDGPRSGDFTPSTSGVPKESKTAVVSQVAVTCRW